jgi:serine/threonine protein kinase/predicted negative regulator of RcsB-dependent stress response
MEHASSLARDTPSASRLDSHVLRSTVAGVPEPTTLTDPAPLLAEVHVYASGSLIAKFAVEPGEYIIGRDATCHIVVDADQVARHHARLTFSSFELLIEDLGSSNGVFIDGVQVQIPTRVRPDQEVQIGSARLLISLHASAKEQFRAALWDKDLGLESVRQVLAGPKYKIVTTIARGGMGVIMQARDLRIRRTVAIKVMKTATQFSRENVLRFIDEAQLTGQLEHPNIVPVYELGLDEQGETFYTMKYVRGITLDEVLRGLRNNNAKMARKYPLGTLLTIFQKICDGVAYAHAKGVVHRDLKPENVMIGAYGEVLVMDWGLAKNVTGMQRVEAGKAVETLGHHEQIRDARGFQTMHGLVVGTPPYISPEQARGELDRIDPRSDIYVLGGILYAILCLRPPVSGSTVAEVIDNILASNISPPGSFNTAVKVGRGTPMPPPEAVPLPHLPGGRIPDSLSAVVMKAMEMDADKRYQSVEEMQEDLTAFQGGFATKAERAGVGKQVLLWAARRKAEVTLIAIFAIIFQILVGMFIYSLKRERDSALANYALAISNEQRAKESEKKVQEALEDLRQTAPTFASDAQALLEDLHFTEALEKVEYAIDQQPQTAEFWALKGNILQSLLRLDEAAKAYETSLGFNPKQPQVKRNLDLTTKLLTDIGPNAKPSPAHLKELQQAMLEQNRVDEAFALLRQLTADRDLFRRTILETFGKLGLRDRVETNDDATVNLDLSGLDLSRGLPGERGSGPGGRRPGMAGLRELRNRPIVSLNLDGARVTDLTVVKGWKLEKLSLNNNPITDLAALSGMSLRVLNADGCPIKDLTPLTGMPLESVRLRNTKIASLAPLHGMRLENLVLAGCRELKSLDPLTGAPLQQLDISRTDVSDLRPIADCPLRELNLEGCSELTDLTPLTQMKQLEAVLIPKQCKNIEFLRTHPTLKRLSYKKLTETTDAFWAAFDSAQKQSPAPPQ